MLLHPTLLLPVLIGCSLASFISPGYVTGYAYYRTGPGSVGNPDGVTSPEGSGQSFETTTRPFGRRDMTPEPSGGRYATSYIARVGHNGKIVITNCALCRLCCIGQNVTYTVVPGLKTPGNPVTPVYPETPEGPSINPNPWVYAVPPASEPPSEYVVPPGQTGLVTEPPVNPGEPQFPEPVNPGRGTPIEPSFPGPYKPYYPVAPGQYATAPPATIITPQPPVPCVPVTTTTTTTLAPTTTPGTPPPCQYTPATPAPTQPTQPTPPTQGPTQPTVLNTYPTIPTSGYATSPPSYVTPPPQYATPETTTTTTTTTEATTIPDSYVVPGQPSTPSTPEWPEFPSTNAPGTTPRGPGNYNECCYIDLRSLQATVSCGAASRNGCCSQSCSSTSTVQRQISINFALLSRYFGQFGTQISCSEAVRIGLVQQTQISGFCTQGYILPTNPPTRGPFPEGTTWGPNPTGPTVYPPGTQGPEVEIPTTQTPGGSDAYIVPKTNGVATVLASFFTILIATVLCL